MAAGLRGLRALSGKVAVAQMTSGGSQRANLETVRALVAEARRRDCRLLCLPEAFSFIGAAKEETRAAAQPLDGPLMAEYRSMAKEAALWLSLGGFQETGPDPDRVYNAHVFVTDDGELASVYRKVHLFDVDVPNGPVLQESSYTAPGGEVVVQDIPGLGRIGVTTCYDLRFPNLYQHLRFDLGCNILLVPSAFAVVTGKAHWDILLRARAIECQSYVIAAAQAGRHNAKRESYGHSIIVDPWGTVVAKREDPLDTGIAVAEIDGELLASIRERMPLHEHRKRGVEVLAKQGGPAG